MTIARMLIGMSLAVFALGPRDVGAADRAETAGTVRFVKAADSRFDAYTRTPPAADVAFMRAHYWRLRAYSPYFDTRLSWAPGAWVYHDAYAIYPSSPDAIAHPDWILRDASGARLWIPFGCSGGTCPQYAADIGNPAFRAAWIARAKAKLAVGYRGLFVDDVNMAERVSNGDGVATLPVDPRTHAPIDEAAWQHLMARFMIQVRAALPGVEIVHNVLWPAGDGTPDLRSQLAAADYVELERGFVDPGIVGGSGRFGFESLLRFIAHRQSDGQGVILDGFATTPQGRLYGLATYFLISSGRDALGNDAAGAPDGWWPGYDVSLGAPRSAAYRRDGIWRRDFERGSVLVNEPGAPRRRVAVGPGYRGLDGGVRRVVTLDAASGAVLLSVRGAPRS
jgi:hypothetical protein